MDSDFESKAISINLPHKKVEIYSGDLVWVTLTETVLGVYGSSTLFLDRNIDLLGYTGSMSFRSGLLLRQPFVRLDFVSEIGGIRAPNFQCLPGLDFCIDEKKFDRIYDISEGKDSIVKRLRGSSSNYSHYIPFIKKMKDSLRRQK